MPRGNGGIIGPVNTSFSGVWSLTEAQLRRSGGAWPSVYQQAINELSTGSDAVIFGSAADPYFEYTTLLLPGNGTNGAQNNTFLDGSTNNFTITRNGNTTQGTFSPFSQTGWGNYFDGSGDWLNYTNTDNFGTSAFTVQAWVWFSATATNDSAFIDGRPTGGSSTGYLMAVRNSSKVLRFASAAAYDGVTPLVANTWNHVAATYTGGTLRLYLNGNLDATFTGLSFNFTDTNFVIGKAHFASGEWTGYISNLQLIKGTALYTSSTYTVPTSPLTAISGTSLLTCQSNRFIDNSTNNFTITRNGDVRVVAFSPFNPTASWSAATYGGSGYFDGSGDYLSAASNAAFGVGSGDFTIECWIYLTSNFNSTGRGIITAAYNTNFALIGTNSGAGNKVDFYVANTVMSSGTNYISLNSWTHIACVRSSGTTKIYFNGVEVGSSASLTGTGATAAVYVGTLSHDTTGTMNGYIADARIVKGTAVYTSAFTPPTAPLTAITNTSLLLNYTNAGIYDATSKNDLETVGNAQISTTQSKWGGSSMSFDGNGDWLAAPTSILPQFGTGDFTIEFWWYPNSLATAQQIISNTNDSAVTGSGEFVITYNTSLGLRFYINAGAVDIQQGSTTGWTTGQWYYVAAVRSGNTLTLYRNGSSIASGSVTGITIGANVPFYIGGEPTQPTSINGYLQDVRITKGYARTVTTSPTAAFPTL